MTSYCCTRMGQELTLEDDDKIRASVLMLVICGLDLAGFEVNGSKKCGFGVTING